MTLVDLRSANDRNDSGATLLSRNRRALLLASASWPLTITVSRSSLAQLPDELMAAVRKHTGGKPLQSGKVNFDIASIVENGNSVPATVSVESPMSQADFVKSIAIFNEKNPQRDVVVTRFGPRSGRARMSTRIRLATSQKLIAVAEMSDGSYTSHAVDVIVALAACIE